MNLRKFLVLSALTSLGLMACSSPPADLGSLDDRGDTLAEDGDFVRLDIEIVGEGEIAILEPYVETCTTADGICSFVFERGTRVEFEAEVALAGNQEAIVHCNGRSTCTLELDHGLTLLANFEASGRSIEGTRTFGFLPGAPWIIIDPARGAGELSPKVPATSPASVVEP